MKNVDAELRRKVVEISRRLYNRGLVAGAGGNISVKKADSQEVFITPSGLCKGYLKSTDILKVDLHGNILEGELKPTSEMSLHIAIYKVRSDVYAVVHAHPPISNGFACAGLPLDYSIYPEIIVMVGEIPLVKYVTPTTEKLAKTVAEYVKRYDALLLETHGTITLGSNLEQAYQRTDLIEDFAKIVLVSKLLGGPKPLSKAEIMKLRDLKSEKYRVGLAKGLG
jgi:L-fuculose-phosphate aldolase